MGIDTGLGKEGEAMSVDIKQATLLSEEMYKAVAPILRGKSGEEVIYAIYQMAAIVTYHGVGGLEMGVVRLTAPKHPPEGLIGEMALAGCHVSIQMIVDRIRPKGENG